MEPRLLLFRRSDTAIAPAYAATLSLAILTVQYLWIALSKLSTDDANIRARYVVLRRAQSTVALNVLRLVCCLALLGVQVYTSTVAPSWTQFALCATFVSSSLTIILFVEAHWSRQAYVSCLSAATVMSMSSWRRSAAAHLGLTLVVTWAISVYSNVWPLATYTLVPADHAEGALLWVKFGLLSVAGVIVPLVVPREYKPYDPEVSTTSISE